MQNLYRAIKKDDDEALPITTQEPSVLLTQQNTEAFVEIKYNKTEF